MSGAGDQCFALESGRDEVELVGGRAGPVEVAGRDRDLDLRLEQRGALQVGVRWSFLGRHPQRVLEGVSDRRCRSGDVTLGQPHEGETRLRIPPGTMSSQQGLLCSGDIALVQSNPSQLVQWPSQLAPQVGAQLLARHQCLILGFVARPAQPEDLGAMHSAAPMEAADGVRLAPPLHRLGPLLGHVVQGEALQGTHELAVDDPSRQRIELARDGRDPGLVEQRQTLLDFAVQDQQAGFGHPADGARRRVTRRTHLDRPPGPLPSAENVTGQHPLVPADDRQPGVGRRVVVAFEQPLSARQPAAHGCHQRGVEEQVHRQTDGRTGGRDLIARLHAGRVGAFPSVDRHIEITGRVGDLAQQR